MGELLTITVEHRNINLEGGHVEFGKEIGFCSTRNTGNSRALEDITLIIMVADLMSRNLSTHSYF